MNLQVISFNIRYNDDVNGNTIAQRAPRLKRVLDQYGADLIGFQECTPTWMPHLEADYGTEYEIFNKYRDKNCAESAPILWKKERFECLDKGYFWFSETPEVESRFSYENGHLRICMWVVLKERISGQVFTYMNTHFGFGDRAQCDSADLIRQYEKKVARGPVIFTGDFNMQRSFPAYEKMSGWYTDVNAATVNDLRNTYHGYTFDQNLDELIDYCFVTRDIAPVIYQRLDQTVGGKFPSDHYGIRAELEL